MDVRSYSKPTDTFYVYQLPPDRWRTKSCDTVTECIPVDADVDLDFNSVICNRLSTGAVYSVLFISGARWTLHWNGWCFKPVRENWWWFVQCFYDNYEENLDFYTFLCQFLYIVFVCLFNSIGWMMGERLHDGERGWFPNRVVEEIQSKEVRAQNLREAFRIQQAQEGGVGRIGVRPGRRIPKTSSISSAWPDQMENSNKWKQ